MSKGWQPIEAAPEGRILGYDPELDEIAIVERCGAGWVVSHDAEGWAWGDFKPKFWTPIPDRPVQGMEK